jgi:hypothetical protein
MGKDVDRHELVDPLRQHGKLQSPIMKSNACNQEK